MSRGYFGIGCWRPKTSHNVGTLWRTAQCMGASFIFTIRARSGMSRTQMVHADPALGQPTDTMRADRHVPYLTFESVGALQEAVPLAEIVGIEQASGAITLSRFAHPERALYLLGAEDKGLPEDVMDACDHLIEISSVRCLNVAVAGSIVVYDRIAKAGGGS